MIVVIFLLVLGVLIFVHELGHYLVAIRNGIKAEEFGFGFPPRIFGVFKDDETGKRKVVFGNKEVKSNNTIFSLNAIPLGGFVKIKGEDGENKDSDSFASKPAWIRIKVLAAGVTMNFLLAWLLLAIVFSFGVPRAIDDNEPANGVSIQLSEVIKNSPAGKMGLSIGDTVLEIKNTKENETLNNIRKIKEVKDFINKNKGKQIEITVRRGNETLLFQGVPRLDYPTDQGSLGVGLTRTAIIKYPWYEAISESLLAVLALTKLIVITLFTILAKLVTGTKQSVDVAGPIGIAFMTKQVVAMGWVYLLQFTAMLSINLAIINAFPFPALDGGRILFVLIEKIKGTPVSQKVEQMAHTIGFSLLILLMIFVTFKDFIHFQIINKIISFF